MKKSTDKKDHGIDMSSKHTTIKDPLKMDDSIASKYRGYVTLDPDKDFILNDEIGKILENSCPTHAITYQNDDDLKIHLDNSITVKRDFLILRHLAPSHDYLW